MSCLFDDLGNNFDVIFDVVGSNSPFARSLWETSFLDDSIVDLHDFTYRKNISFNKLFNIFGYQFWH